MSTEKETLAMALKEVASGSQRSKIARLREIFDEVEAAKAAGTSNKVIVATLEAYGLLFDVNNFKNARSRILKERAIQNLERVAREHSVSASPQGSSVTPGVGAGRTTKRPAVKASSAKAGSNSQGSNNSPVLVRPPGISDARWSEMQAQARRKSQNQR